MTHWDGWDNKYNFDVPSEHDKLIELIINDSPGSIIEFAAGTGNIPHQLRRMGYNGRYTITDFCNPFLDEARKNNPDCQTMFVDMNIPLEIPTESYDAAVISSGLGYVDDYKKTLEEVYRVIRKSLYLCMVNPFTDDKDDYRFVKDHSAGNRYNKKKFFKAIEDIGFIVRYYKEDTSDNKYKFDYLILDKR